MSKETTKPARAKKATKAPQVAATKAVAKNSPTAITAKPKAVRKKPASPAKRAKKSATILAKADIGFGNQMFIRGEGPGLSWDHGALMECKDANQWHWSTEDAEESFAFKVLINDQLWAHGENDTVEPGQTKTIQPTF